MTTEDTVERTTGELDGRRAGTVDGRRHGKQDRPEDVLIVHSCPKERTKLMRLVERLEIEVEAVGDVDAAIDRVRSDAPSLTLLDAATGGVELCHEIFDLAELTSIVMISAADYEPEDRIAGLLAGADDYLSEPFDRAELLARIRRLLERRRQLLSIVPTPPNPLSAREFEVLGLLAAARTSSEIAQELVISRKTVATHIQHILAKLGVHSQAQAVAHAYMHGLFPAAPIDVTDSASLVGSGSLR